jgi:hypothetical protein
MDFLRRPVFKTKIKTQRLGTESVSVLTQCRREGREVGTKYRGPAVRKGARGPTIFHMFMFFFVVSLFVYCTN